MDTDTFLHVVQRNCHLLPHTHVIVAFSGGADSTALLHLLANCPLQLRLTAVYINHGLRPDETVREEEHVLSFSSLLGINCHIRRVDAASHRQETSSSLEESCRVLRYRELERVRREVSGDCIAVGHTADDQAEELLLRLVRGTGLRGLSGMRFSHNLIIRPLLSATKEELLAYLQLHDIPFCFDSSNLDEAFLRNRVRRQLLPLLAQDYNPSIRQVLNRTADILRADDDFLDISAEASMTTCTEIHTQGSAELPRISLDSQRFSTFHRAVQRRIMEKLCWKLSSPPQYVTLVSLCRLAATGKTGSELHLSSGVTVRKAPSALLFFQGDAVMPHRQHPSEASIQPRTIEAAGETIVADICRRLVLAVNDNRGDTPSPGELLVDGDTISFPLTLRSHREGERFTPSGMSGTKKVARFLADCKIPRHERIRYPVLVDEKGVIAVLGLRVDQGRVATEHTTRFMKISWNSSP